MPKKTDLPVWMLTLVCTVAFAFDGLLPHAADAHVAQGAVRPWPESAQRNDNLFFVGADVTTTTDVSVGFDATTKG